MCLACLEAELWLAYQEEMATREKAAAGQEGVAPAGTPADPAKPRTPPDHPAAPFACEEPPST